MRLYRTGRMRLESELGQVQVSLGCLRSRNAPACMKEAARQVFAGIRTGAGMSSPQPGQPVSAGQDLRPVQSVAR